MKVMSVCHTSILDEPPCGLLSALERDPVDVLEKKSMNLENEDGIEIKIHDASFMGQPRDVHVHEHAHEIPLMKWPLVALAVGTFLSSWFLFRDLIGGSR